MVLLLVFVFAGLITMAQLECQLLRWNCLLVQTVANPDLERVAAHDLYNDANTTEKIEYNYIIYISSRAILPYHIVRNQ